jgi:hypothetical protein
MNDTNHTGNVGARSWSDCVDFWFDGPADHTVRPIPPERLEQAKALRDQILAAGAAEKHRTHDSSTPQDS